jgi:hypothetical protein
VQLEDPYNDQDQDLIEEDEEEVNLQEVESMSM